jgi:tRNA-2-methylthio-N6-dimethylallyladenosine synthase
MLRTMNRGHTADDYRRLVDRLRAARPDLALSTDIIAGHPGESDADHAATLALIRDIGFAQAFSFKYSARPGTPASTMAGAVAEAVKDVRLAEIQALLRDQQAAFNRTRAGMVAEVLVTGPGRHPGQMAGRTPWLNPVHFDGPAGLAGRVVPVKILAGHPNSLSGALAASAENSSRERPAA